MEMGRLSIQAIWIAASLTASFGGDVCDVRDSWALVQMDYVQVLQSGSDAGVVPGTAEPKSRLVDDASSAHQKWPELGDIWDDIKESMGNFTVDVGDLTRNPNHRLGEELYNRTLEGMALFCAKALNKALLVTDKATNKLLQKTLEFKAELMKFLNNTPRVLPAFEWALNKTLSGAIFGWRIMRAAVDASGHAIVSGFRAAGQEGLSDEFGVVLDTSLDKMDDFVEAMGNATVDLEGISKPVGAELHQRLHSMDLRFKRMLRFVPEFGVMFQQAFQVVLDHISDALPTTSPTLQMEFDSVLHNVTAIVWRMRSSSRELVLTCHSAVSLVAKQSHAELPAWEVIMTSERSAGVRAGGLLTFAMLAAVIAAQM